MCLYVRDTPTSTAASSNIPTAIIAAGKIYYLYDPNKTHLFYGYQVIGTFNTPHASATPDIMSIESCKTNCDLLPECIGFEYAYRDSKVDFCQ